MDMLYRGPRRLEGTRCVIIRHFFFKELLGLIDDQLDQYIFSGEPLDKAIK